MDGKAPNTRGWLVGLFAIAVLLGVGYVLWLSLGAPLSIPSPADAMADQTSTPKPTRTKRPTRTPRPTETPRASATPSPVPNPKKIGIVAGHWQNDVGAECPDGLQEVTINRDVASRVVAILESKGYEADLLPEFAEELHGYEADAFVSIHTDACNVPGASGFKVARVASSAIPEQEDRLVACLIQEYGEKTGLAFHRNSITYDMTAYHAFNEIAPETPGAIIELGFMEADQVLLTEDSYKVAEGVAQGIICFVEGE